MSYVSLYKDREGYIQENIVDFDEEELSRGQRAKCFLRDVRAKYRLLEEKSKSMGVFFYSFIST